MTCKTEIKKATTLLAVLHITAECVSGQFFASNSWTSTSNSNPTFTNLNRQEYGSAFSNFGGSSQFKPEKYVSRPSSGSDSFFGSSSSFASDSSLFSPTTSFNSRPPPRVNSFSSSRPYKSTSSSLLSSSQSSDFSNYLFGKPKPSFGSNSVFSGTSSGNKFPPKKDGERYYQGGTLIINDFSEAFTSYKKEPASENLPAKVEAPIQVEDETDNLLDISIPNPGSIQQFYFAPEHQVTGNEYEEDQVETETGNETNNDEQGNADNTKEENEEQEQEQVEQEAINENEAIKEEQPDPPVQVHPPVQLDPPVQVHPPAQLDPPVQVQPPVQVDPSTLFEPPIQFESIGSTNVEIQPISAPVQGNTNNAPGFVLVQPVEQTVLESPEKECAYGSICLKWTHCAATQGKYAGMCDALNIKVCCSFAEDETDETQDGPEDNAQVTNVSDEETYDGNDEVAVDDGINNDGDVDVDDNDEDEDDDGDVDVDDADDNAEEDAGEGYDNDETTEGTVSINEETNDNDINEGNGEEEVSDGIVEGESINDESQDDIQTGYLPPNTYNPPITQYSDFLSQNPSGHSYYTKGTYSNTPYAYKFPSFGNELYSGNVATGHVYKLDLPPKGTQTVELEQGNSFQSAEKSTTTTTSTPTTTTTSSTTTATTTTATTAKAKPHDDRLGHGQVEEVAGGNIQIVKKHKKKKPFTFGAIRFSTFLTEKNKEKSKISSPSCSAAMLCVKKSFCTLNGEVAKTKQNIPPFMRRFSGVPLLPCKMANSSEEDTEKDDGTVCCRDTSYVDPWP